jgi:cell division protein FtsB
MRWEDIFTLIGCGISAWVGHNSGKQQAYRELEQQKKVDEIEKLRYEISSLRKQINEKKNEENII